MWLIVTSICSLAVLIGVTMMCLCWKKKTEKNDLLGLDGLVTQKNPDENVNHLPSVIVQSIPDGPVQAADDTAIDSNKRPAVVNNPRRSLPDIPLDGIRTEGDVAYEPNGDNTSDLYATVEPYQNLAKRHTLPNGIDSRPSISQHSSISQADDTFSPYARLSEHPYDKVRKMEHPYARVHSTQEQDENSSSEATPRPTASRNCQISTLQTLNESSVGGSRSQRSSSHSAVESDIPAASAVAGGIAANQDLPYMTPPITQPNFSGDSQDSSRGYTSISVREPLANIRAQTKIMTKLHGDVDPHYSTVSDDSDDMYTTIQDPNNPIYTSGSETYAQIQPLQLTVAAEINSEPLYAANSSSESCKDEKLRAPQPPSVGCLKNVTHTHSRQASSSSSVGNLSSPKPEKRQANSPLPPPPPPSSQDLLSNKPSTSKNLDDMYAKVQKNKKKNDELEEVEMPNKPKESKKVRKEKLFSEHDYETLKKNENIDYPGYEKLSLGNEEEQSEPNYDTINCPDSILSSDPGYEVLSHSSDEQHMQRSSCMNDNNRLTVENNGYSTVNKQSKSDTFSEEVKSKNSSSYESDTRDLSSEEINYESMPSESEHNYAVVKSGSESDPNYESVNHNDPNYESVKYLDVSLGEDPPYERLQDDDSSKTSSHASSKSMSLQNGQLKVKNENNVDPGYETIKSESVKMDNDVINVQFESDYDGIVQV